MTNWIRTKAGLQMAETIIRYLPRIFVCLEEMAKVYTFKGLDAKNGIKIDIRKLADEMDLRNQENINLSHRVKELETMLKDYQPEYKSDVKFLEAKKVWKIMLKYSEREDVLTERITRLETILEERK